MKILKFLSVIIVLLTYNKLHAQTVVQSGSPVTLPFFLSNAIANPIYVNGTTATGIYIGFGNAPILDNIAIGQGCLLVSTATTGAPPNDQPSQRNVAIGIDVMNTNTNGRSNVAIGFEAMKYTNGGAADGEHTASNNVAVGAFALHGQSTSYSTGSSNTAIGNAALMSNTIGYSNTAVGQDALHDNQDGIQNVAVGIEALDHNVDGSKNSVLGRRALYWCTHATNNVIMGFNAAYNLPSSDGNHAFGYFAMLNLVAGNNNSAFGSGTLAGEAGFSPVGGGNAAFGNSALEKIHIANSNSAFGHGALNSLETGSWNVGIGEYSQVKNGNSYQLSIQNTIWGTNMDHANNSDGSTSARVGIGTTLLGSAADAPSAALDVNGHARIRFIDQAEDNRILTADVSGNVHYRPFTDFGTPSCTWNDGVSSTSNMFTGISSACKKGYVCVGIRDDGALLVMPSGMAKLYVYNSEANDKGNYTMGIVAEAKAETKGIAVYGYADTKNQGIGLYGMCNFVCDEVEQKVRNIAVYGGPNVDGWVDQGCDHPNGFWASYFAGPQFASNDPILVSDARLKKDVKEIDNADEIISKLAPKTYFFRHDVEKGFVLSDKRQYGFISQEVEKVLPELVEEVPGPVTPDEKGNMVASKETYKGLAYDELIAVLVKAVQNQNDKISELQAQVNNLSQGNTTAKTNAQAIMLGDDNVQQVVLYQNVPNPFSEKTTIAYQVPANAKDAEIRFYNQTGYLIKAAQLYNKGKGTVEVFGNGVAAGVYTYVLYVDGKIVANKKMVKQ